MSTYVEETYTTTIKTENLTKEQIKSGFRIEKEINSAFTSNVHRKEERNQVNLKETDETGLYRNEEMLYSGVVRKTTRVVPEPRKKFTCKNAKLDDSNFSEMMAR